MDLFVTGLKLAGVPVPADRVIDGVDMAPILFDGGASRRDVHYFYRGTQLYAVRKGRGRRTGRPGRATGRTRPRSTSLPALYHLGLDPGEQFDVAKDHPEVIAELEREAERHRATLAPVETNLDALLPDASR